MISYFRETTAVADGASESSFRPLPSETSKLRATWTEAFILSTAAEQGPCSSLSKVIYRSLVRELVLRYRRRINFRTAYNTSAGAAYSKMTVDEFNDINLRQAWANWRTIPRNLNGRLPSRGMQAIDLCCGTGDSLAVLAFYLPVGSQITGLELTERFVTAARRRVFRNATGQIVRPQLHCQSVLKQFWDGKGRRFADKSIDLVNASGALGCHFRPCELRSLAGECAQRPPSGRSRIDRLRLRRHRSNRHGKVV